MIDVISEENLVERANQIGTLFERRLSGLQRRYPDVIGDIRVKRGAMIAMELVKDGNPDQPEADLTRELLAKSWQNGLILLSCGIRGNVVRFLPALTISDELINEGLDILEACFKELLE